MYKEELIYLARMHFSAPSRSSHRNHSELLWPRANPLSLLSLYRRLTASSSGTWRLIYPWLVSRNWLLKVSASALPQRCFFLSRARLRFIARAMYLLYTARSHAYMYTLRRQETRSAPGTLAPFEAPRKQKKCRCREMIVIYRIIYIQCEIYTKTSSAL